MNSRAYYLIFLFSASVNASIELNYNDLEKKLIESNEHIAAAKKFKEAASYREGHLRRKFYPTLGLEAGAEKFTTGPYNGLEQPFGTAKLNINLYNGNRDQIESKTIDVLSLQKEIEYKKAIASGLFKVRTMYWSYFYNQEILKIYEDAKSINQKNLQLALIRIKRGISTGTDKIEFEQNSLKLDQDLAKAKIEIENIERQIKTILSIDEKESLVIKESNSYSKIETSNSESFDPSLHLDFLWLKQEKLRNDLMVKSERNWWLPTVDVYASASQFTQKDRDYLTNDERNDYTIGIVFKMNLFDGGESYNMFRSSQLYAEGLLQESLELHRDIDTEYKNAKSLYNLNHQLIINAEENIKKSEGYYQNIISEYNRGVKNSLDLLMAGQKVALSKVELAKLKMDYQLENVKIEYIKNEKGEKVP